MDIKKLDEFEPVNEANLNDTESIKFNLKRIIAAGYKVNIAINNGRLILSDKNGYNLLDTNNNNLGVSNMNTFIAGLYFGITLEK
jgi:hypothetical protein